MLERFGGSGSIRNGAYHHFDPKWGTRAAFCHQCEQCPGGNARGFLYDNMRTSFSSSHKRNAKKRDGHSGPLAALVPLALIGLPRT